MSTTAHDALFKHTFSQPEDAAGELRTVLPAGVVERIDGASLKHEPTTFVDEAGASSIAVAFGARGNRATKRREPSRSDALSNSNGKRSPERAKHRTGSSRPSSPAREGRSDRLGTGREGPRP